MNLPRVENFQREEATTAESNCQISFEIKEIALIGDTRGPTNSLTAASIFEVGVTLLCEWEATFDWAKYFYWCELELRL